MVFKNQNSKKKLGLSTATSAEPLAKPELAAGAKVRFWSSRDFFLEVCFFSAMFTVRNRQISFSRVQKPIDSMKISSIQPRTNI